MDVTGLEVLQRLGGRWPAIQAKCAATLADEASNKMLAGVIAVFQTAQTGGLENGLQAAGTLGRTLHSRGYPFSQSLEVMFQIRKASRPFLVREYPGVEGFLEGQLQFEEICNALLKQMSRGYYSSPD